MAFTDTTTDSRVIREGVLPVRITLTDTCDTGDLIGYDGVTSDTWVKADADGKIPAQLIAGEKCNASGDEIVCFKMAYVGGFSGATSGDMVYLSTTAGSYGATAGTWVNQCVGECVSDTEAFIHPSCSALFSYATTGTSWAAQLRSELESGRVSEDLWGGMRIDVKAISGSTVSSDVYGLYIFTQLQSIPAASTAMIRLEDGCAASCGFDSYLMFIGGSLSDPPDYWAEFSTLTPTNSAWEIASNQPTGSGGYIKLNFGGSDRYIALYTASTGG